MLQKINLRSPFYIKATPTFGTFISAEIKLYIYTGIYVTDKPASPQYTITKSAIGSDSYATFEIAELVRDYLDVSFNQEFTEDEYITRVLDDGGVFARHVSIPDREVGHLACTADDELVLGRS